MRHEMTYEEKYRMMVETPVNRLIPSLAVPTIISMLITSIYNMADTFFVSQLSTSASGAVGVNFSLIRGNACSYPIILQWLSNAMARTSCTFQFL